MQSSLYVPEVRDAEVEQSDDAGVLAKVPDAVRKDLERGHPRDLLIELVDSASEHLGLSDQDGAPLAHSVRAADDAVRERADRYRQLQERVLEQASSDSLSLRFQYVNVPLLHVRAQDLEGLLQIARLPEVLTVHEDVKLEHQLAESLPLIQQPAVAASGNLGAGTAVAVLDTGCDFTRSAFGSCSSAGAAGCKVAYAADFGSSDNVRDTNYHGTNVSAIVLGVAPSTKILALDVFEGSTASSSTILTAIDWVISHRATYNIVAMNMSLGSGSYTTACGSNVFATAIGNARDAGILSAVASGNGSLTSAISSPACVPTAISVGATYDANVGGLSYSGCSDAATSADKVTCFSNSASFLSMLAPGAPITAGGVTMTGTSQASPHVAGAIAVARSAFPTEPIDATVSRLVNTGPSITDPRNGVTLHRLDLNAALGGAGVVDVTPPTGTLQINQGAAATRTASVSLALTSNDDGGATTMCISNTTTCTKFTAFAATRSWSLASGNGVKTVYVTLRDASNNRTTLSASIMLDTTVPTGSTLSATPSDGQVQLTWTEASDTGSGVASYKVQVNANKTTAPSCATGTTVYTGSALSFTHTGLSNGTPYAYRVCPVDAAGNVGTGSVASTRPAPEFDGPVGQVTINQDASYTNRASVTLSLSASDASGVASMCISNTTTCPSFSAFTTTRTWTLARTNGTSTVRVWFKDIYGNVSAAPASDTIILDTAVPTTSAISATAGDGTVTLNWTASTDALSGLAGYKIVGAPKSAPSCATGASLYTGNALTTTVSGLTNGVVYGFRVCPMDVAGNLATGGTTTARPAPEFIGPTGSVVINQAAQYTKSRSVTLTLSASDASGVAAMCVSNTTTCTAFSTYATTKTWSLSVSSGTATVRVWFRDIYGNVSAAPASDTIIVDTAVPTTSTISAAADNGSVTLQWTASTDALSGLAGYKIVGAPKTAPSCATGAALYTGNALTATISGLTNGVVYAFRVCPMDVAGNLATGGTTTARPAPEFIGPTGSVVINQAAQYTNSRSVTLTLSATDASGVAAMCVSNTTSCTSFSTYATTKTWSLSTASGTATVRVWFKDSYGNVSAAPATDTIVVDTTAPTTSTISAVADNGSVTLQWSAATDTLSGLAGYKIVGAPKTAPSCATGAALYTGNALTATISGLTNGVVYAFRVCPMDIAGNLATGGTISARPAPEFTGPTGSVVINQAAEYTKSRSVTLTLSATDASGVAAMCVSNTTTCTTFSTYATTKTWSLSSTNGPATVRAWFRDTYGNVSSAAATDTILVDTRVPASSTLQVVANNGAAALSWTASHDTGSGLAGYRVRYALNRAPTCTSGTEIYSGTGLSFVHTGLTNGAVYAYRVCPFDVAGNAAAAGTASATPSP